MAPRTRLVLFAHGSRDPRWAEPFERLRGDLASALGEGAVRLAYMEFVPPTLMDVAGEAAAEGIEILRVLPLFLAGGAHVARDIPEQAAAVRAAHPALVVEILPPIGEHPRFAALLREIARESAAARNPG